jgi:hypothetical protein
MAVLALLFFLFRNKIKNLITKRVEKKQDIVDFIYQPVGIIRTFSVNFTIEEKGDGTAKISIIK